MITEFSSTSLRTTSTPQDFMNDLKNCWTHWTNVVYDTADSSQVTELWISTNLYIALDTTSTASVKLCHSVRGIAEDYGTNYETYKIIVTDKGLLASLWFRNSYGRGFAIASTTKNNYGFVMNTGGATNETGRNVNRRVLTEGIESSRITAQSFTGATTSVSLIQLFDVISPDENTAFSGVYNVFITPPGATGKMLINSKHYYTCFPAGLALEYTAS